MEIGRGGACVPARVAPQGRIHRSSPAHNACILGVGTPLRRRSGGHAGAAPTVLFGQIAHGRLVSFGVNCAWTEFCLYGIAWKNMMEMGRGGAYVPDRVAPQGRIHRSIPHTQCVYFWYGNAAARTFGRAHRRRPYGFVWVDCTWTVDVVWADCVCDFACWENGAHEPTPSVLYFCQPRVD